MSALFVMPTLAETFIGAHYAAGISTVYFLPHTNETWRITPCYAGIVYRYYVDNERHKYFNIGIQLELNYGMRRYRFDDKIATEFSVDTIDKKIYSHVLELPIIMQWQFPVTENFRLYLNGLVYAAYYVRNNAYYTDKDGLSMSERFDYKNWNNFDFGIGGGLGAGYKIGRFEIGIDARFLMGISELYPQTPNRYESLPQQYLLSVSIIRNIN
jgi:hypothetical protein